MEDGNPFALIGQVADSELLMGSVALFFVLARHVHDSCHYLFLAKVSICGFPDASSRSTRSWQGILGAQVINGAALYCQSLRWPLCSAFHRWLYS